MIGPLAGWFPRRVERKAEEGEAGDTASGVFAWACEVMRPPKDLPPAISGRPGQARAASATAPRTAACAIAGGSGRLPPFSI